MDKRKLQKNHIKAAREWLKAAENSLDGGNDVASDLKLMLAKAELSNTKLTLKSQRLRAGLKKIMPAAVAILLGAGFYLWQGEEKVAKIPPTATTLPPPSTAPEISPAPPPVAVEKDKTVTAADKVVKNKTVEDNKAAIVNEEKNILEERAPAKISETPKEENNLPSKEMQQLMQSAGKVLRK